MIDLISSSRPLFNFLVKRYKNDFSPIFYFYLLIRVPFFLDIPSASFSSSSSSEAGREILVQHLLVKEDDQKLLLELQKRVVEGQFLYFHHQIAHNVCLNLSVEFYNWVILGCHLESLLYCVRARSPFCVIALNYFVDTGIRKVQFFLDFSLAIWVTKALVTFRRGLEWFGCRILSVPIKRGRRYAWLGEKGADGMLFMFLCVSLTGKNRNNDENYYLWKITQADIFH